MNDIRFFEDITRKFKLPNVELFVKNSAWQPSQVYQLLMVFSNLPDRDVWLQHGIEQCDSKFRIYVHKEFPSDFDEKQFVSFVHGVYISFMVHEACELFIYDGERIMDPHCVSHHKYQHGQMYDLTDNQGCIAERQV